jgi:hypothetical protein
MKTASTPVLKTKPKSGIAVAGEIIAFTLEIASILVVTSFIKTVAEKLIEERSEG